MWNKTQSYLLPSPPSGAPQEKKKLHHELCFNSACSTTKHDTVFSLHQWLPPVSPGSVNGISTRLAVSADLFLVEMMGTAWISCEVQHV